MRLLGLALLVALLLTIAVRPSPRGWTEQGVPVVTPTAEAD